MTRLRALAIALLFLGGLGATAPSASACSLVGYHSLAELTWSADDRLDTNVGNGPGRVSLNTGQLLALLDQYTFASAVSPDGRWVVVSYYDGGLGTDCTMEFVTTDALDLATGDRVRLLDAATHAMAASADRVFLSGYECGPVVHAFAWGQWEQPERLGLGGAPGAPDDFEHVRGLAVDADETRLAVATGDHVFVYDLRERAFQAGQAQAPYDSVTPGNAFALTTDGLRLAVVEGTWDALRVGVYETTTSVTRQASYAYPSADEDDRPAGAPAWQPEGGALAFASSRVLKVVDSDGTARQVTLPSSGEFLGTPAWSPDGDRVAVGTRGDTSADASLSIYKDTLDLDRRLAWDDANPDVPPTFSSWDPPIDDYAVGPLHTCESGHGDAPGVPVPSAGLIAGLGAVASAAYLARRP